MSKTTTPPRESEVAMWHRLSGTPDDVTDTGEVVTGGRGRRLQSQKELLRAEIEYLRGSASAQVAGLARLAGSYLRAGDVETARRYLSNAREMLERLRNQGLPG
jgi:hypothetical protein